MQCTKSMARSTASQPLQLLGLARRRSRRASRCTTMQCTRSRGRFPGPGRLLTVSSCEAGPRFRHFCAAPAVVTQAPVAGHLQSELGVSWTTSPCAVTSANTTAAAGATAAIRPLRLLRTERLRQERVTSAAGLSPACHRAALPPRYRAAVCGAAAPIRAAAMIAAVAASLPKMGLGAARWTAARAHASGIPTEKASSRHAARGCVRSPARRRSPSLTPHAVPWNAVPWHTTTRARKGRRAIVTAKAWTTRAFPAVRRQGAAGASRAGASVPASRSLHH